MSLYPKKIVWVAVLLLPLLLHGKGGEAHVDDMAAVFGPSAVSALREFFEKVTHNIDDYRDTKGRTLTQRLKAVAPNFKQGEYSHRIYFHWGFNQPPMASSALKQCIENATDDKGKQMEMYRIVLAEQSARNQSLMRCVKEKFLDPNDRSRALKRSEINAITALAYDTHILGDYVEGTDDTRKPLMPMEKLVKDITAVFDRLKRDDDVFRNHPDRPLLQKEFNRRMLQAARASSAS